MSRKSLLILLFTISSCVTSKQSSDWNSERPIQVLKLGILRDSAVEMLPKAMFGIAGDFFDLQDSGPGGCMYLGFDSLNRLDYLSHLDYVINAEAHAPVPNNPIAAQLSRRMDSLITMYAVSIPQYDSAVVKYEDSAKDFTFSGTIKNGWKAYWWRSPSRQTFLTFKGDSQFTCIQSVSSLRNPERKNIPFNLPGDTIQLYLPYWP